MLTNPAIPLGNPRQEAFIAGTVAETEVTAAYREAGYRGDKPDTFSFEAPGDFQLAIAAPARGRH